MTEPTELMPCPFCGAAAHFEMDEGRWEWVECESCGMQGNRSASLMEDCKPKLVEAWNRRTPAPVGVEPVASVHRDSLAMLNSGQVRPWGGGARLYPASKARFDEAYVGVYTSPQPTQAQAGAPSEPTPAFDDHRVQAVYGILCDDDDWPPKDEPQKHWEGWIARRIVERLFQEPVAREPLTPREMELIDGMIAVQLDHATRCDAIANRAMADKQKGWDMERVALLQKLKAAAGRP